MIRVLLCREMGWTYQEYDEQPVHFVMILLTLLQAEGKKNRVH